jgi:hypothetical protein
MEVVELKHDVFAVNDFLTPQECRSIIDYLEWQVRFGYIDWNQISFYGSFAMGYWPSDNNLIGFGLTPTYFSELKERIKLATEKAFGHEMTEISFHAQKWKIDGFADYHSDNSDEHGNPSAFERSKFATFVYLNDNYTGGTLKFKDSDLEIKPKAGTLLTFMGGHENMHMVTTVKDAERYTVGSFWDDAASVYTDEQKKRWEDELAGVRAEQAELYVKWDKDAESGNAPKLPER